jgi:hypothetical protein
MAHYNPDRKPQKRRINVSIVVAIIGALGAIIAALVAKNYIVINTNPGASGAGSSSTPAAPSTSSSVPSNTSGGAVPPNTTSGEVLRKGRITLTNGYCVDLDSTAPNWAVTSDCSTDGAINGKGDIRELTDDGGLYAPNSNNDFAPLDPSQSATFATCDAATDYTTTIDTNSVIQGLRFCVRTTSGNFALMQVINAHADANDVGLTSATFKVTVWKGRANN